MSRAILFAFGVLAGLMAGAQLVLHYQPVPPDCREVVAAERLCVERLAQLLIACGYGEGAPTPEDGGI